MCDYYYWNEPQFLYGALFEVLRYATMTLVLFRVSITAGSGLPQQSLHSRTGYHCLPYAYSWLLVLYLAIPHSFGVLRYGYTDQKPLLYWFCNLVYIMGTLLSNNEMVQFPHAQEIRHVLFLDPVLVYV